MKFFVFCVVGFFVLRIVLRFLNWHKVIGLFEKFSIITFGPRGSGKDLLNSNVVAYRKKPYCSNMNYCEGIKKEPLRYPFNPVYIRLGGNKFSNFAGNHIIPYDYPLPDKCDFYISDAGVYFPAHEDSSLNKQYPEIPMFQALVRHLGDSNFHCNVQNPERLWKKIREQAELYVRCIDCKVSKRGIVTQKIMVYDRYQSAVDSVEPLKVAMPLFGRGVKTDISLTRAKFKAQYGNIWTFNLKYKNKACYDSRRFKRILEQGTSDENNNVVVKKVG